MWNYDECGKRLHEKHDKGKRHLSHFEQRCIAKKKMFYEHYMQRGRTTPKAQKGRQMPLLIRTYFEGLQ